VSRGDYVLGRAVSSDRERVAGWLEQNVPPEISAVIATETHFDHAMDVANVADLTGGRLLGGASTANVALGAGLSPDQIDVVTYGETRRFGNFTIEFIESRHVTLLFRKIPHDGSIDAPLKQPAAAHEYHLGDRFGLVIRHPAGTIVTHVSPADDFRYRDWTPMDIRAVFMSVTLYRNRRRFLERVISPLNPDVLYPIHCDSLFRDLPEVAGEYRSLLKANAARLARSISRRNLPYSAEMIEPYSQLVITPRPPAVP
jgi:L-ascorbate metabolism protein UlaG (beta-lactamase superfamily)